MKRIRLLIFTVRFALIDLFGSGRARSVAFLNLMSVLVLVAFAVVVYGLVSGSDARQIEQFRNDPLAGCLIFRPITPGMPITAAEVVKLEAAIGDRLPHVEHLRGVVPYYRVERDCLVPKSKRQLSFEGRTLGHGDPLLDSFQDKEEWLFGGAFAPHQIGVIIDDAMRKQLRLDLKALPTQLLFDSQTGPIAIDLVGVLKTSLPGRLSFLLLEKVNEELRAKDRVQRARTVRSGLLPAKWDEPPSTALNYLKKHKIRFLDRDPFETGWAWSFEFESAQEPPRLDRWLEHLENVVKLIEKESGALSADQRERIIKVVPLGGVTLPPLTPPTFYRVSVYLLHPDDLDPAIEAAQTVGFELEDDRYEQLRRIRRSTKRAMQAWDIVLVAMAALAMWNIFAIQNLQAQQKRAELGMLKAMGLTGWTLLLIGCWEAFCLWIPGLSFGLYAGAWLGHLAESWMSRDDPATMLAFTVPYERLGYIILASLGACLVSTLLAMRKALWSSPVECMAEA